MIKLMDILQEGKVEKAAEDYLSMMIKKSPFKGKVFIAGGYVRDLMMNLDPKDIDLVVALPDGGIKFANWITKEVGVYKSGSNPVVYPKFGTAKFQLYKVVHKGVNIGDLEIEAVMTRKEKYTPGSRKPEVSSGDLKDDVERRDFTVNSLLKDLTTGEILDLTGMGVKDIKSGVVQTTLNPDLIFKEDPLRMLRAIRFTVKYKWKLPLFMIRSLKKNASQLSNISSERIQVELNKMLVTEKPAVAVRILQLTGLSKYIMPELDLLVGLKQNKYHQWDAMKHTLEVLKKVPPKLTTRLAALFHDIGKPTVKSIVDNEIHFYQHEDVSGDIAADILTRLKYPNEVINAVRTAVKGHMRLKQAGMKGEVVSDKALRKLKAKLGDHLEDTLDLIDADNKSHSPKYNLPDQIVGVRSRYKKMGKMPVKPKLPINGNDIMKRFKLKPGPILGKLTKELENAWFENPKLSKSQAFAIVKKTLRKMK